MAIKVYPTGDYQVHFDDGYARLYFRDKKITGVFDTSKEETANEVNYDTRL